MVTVMVTVATVMMVTVTVVTMAMVTVMVRPLKRLRA